MKKFRNKKSGYEAMPVSTGENPMAYAFIGVGGHRCVVSQSMIVDSADWEEVKEPDAAEKYYDACHPFDGAKINRASVINWLRDFSTEQNAELINGNNRLMEAFANQLTNVEILEFVKERSSVQSYDFEDEMIKFRKRIGKFNG